MSAVLCVSLIPGDTTNASQGRSFWSFARDVAHGPAYGLMAILLIKALGQARYRLVFIIAVGFGVFNEYVQGFVPGRDMSIQDVCFNALGVVLGIWVMNRITKGNKNA